MFFFFSFFSFFAGNLVSSGQHSRGNVSAKLGVGVRCFLDISNPCISKTVGFIKTNMEVLGRLRPHFFFSIASKRAAGGEATTPEKKRPLIFGI